MQGSRLALHLSVYRDAFCCCPEPQLLAETALAWFIRSSGMPNSRFRRTQVGPSLASIRSTASGESVCLPFMREETQERVTVQRGRSLELARPVCQIAVS